MLFLPVNVRKLLKFSTCLTLLSYFASSLRVRPVCCEAVSTTAGTWRRTRWWVSILFCLFVCLSVWGRLALARLFHLYPSPWQRSSRDTQLSSNTPHLPQLASPTDCCGGACLFDMPEQHWQRSSPRRLPWHHRLPGRQSGSSGTALFRSVLSL